jgi:hypothetical protein
LTVPGLLWVLIGLGILWLVMTDVFLTVLHHWGRSGPLGRAVNRMIWSVALRLARRLSPGRRRWLLGLTGPMLIPIVVAFWAFLVITGFAFLYLPGFPEYFERWGRPLPVRSPFSDAFYFSGYTFFTLGYGDIVPLTTTLRVIAIVESGAGFALITLVISYYVSVYVAYDRKSSFAQSLHYQMGGEPDAANLICRRVPDVGDARPLAETMEQMRDGLVRVRADYSNYPILHYYRDAEPSLSFLRLLFVAQELMLLLDSTIDPRANPRLTRLADVTGLRLAVHAAQDSLVRSMLRQVPHELRREADRPDPDRSRRAEHRGEAALARFQECGLATRPRDEAVRAYRDGREEWEPLLRACAEALGESWDEVEGTTNDELRITNDEV